MIRKKLGSQGTTFASHPRLLRATFICALSATVRLIPATEAGPKVPLLACPTHNPRVSIMTASDDPIFCRREPPICSKLTTLSEFKSCRAWPLERVSRLP
jgi:hypothetical protein